MECSPTRPLTRSRNFTNYFHIFIDKALCLTISNVIWIANWFHICKNVFLNPKDGHNQYMLVFNDCAPRRKKLQKAAFTRNGYSRSDVIEIEIEKKIKIQKQIHRVCLKMITGGLRSMPISSYTATTTLPISVFVITPGKILLQESDKGQIFY